MNLPDELILKEEIKEIADKIDKIINTVKEYYPLDQDPSPDSNKISDQQDR